MHTKVDTRITLENGHACYDLECDCGHYAVASEWGENGECLECGSEVEWDEAHAEWFPCDCFELTADYLTTELAAALPDTSDSNSIAVVRIEGRNLGWRNLTGYRVMSRDDFLDNPHEAIAPERTEWTQRWTIGPDGVECMQSHHDSPTGEYITVSTYAMPLDEWEWWHANQ